MGLPISIGDAVAAIDFAVKLYEKVQGSGDQIDRVGESLGTLQVLLRSFDDLVKDKKSNALAFVRKYLRDEVISVMQKTKRDVQEIQDILEIWQQEVGNKFVMKAWWAMGKLPGKLEDLEQRVDKRREDLSYLLQHMQTHFLINSAMQAKEPKPKALPEPPRPPKSLAITFVDPHNLGRSRVAEAFTKLLRERTTRSNNAWRIRFCHSAGIRAMARSDCVQELKAAGVPMDFGNKPAAKNAMDALFSGNVPFKEKLEQQMREARSRGLSKDLFRTYDRIIVFHGRDMDFLLKLHRLAGFEGGARVVNLGAYVRGKKGGMDIVSIKSNEHDPKARDEWQMKVAEIKMHVKAFLKQETGWEEPKWGSWK